MSETVLVDTGYWIALFDPRDKSHREAAYKADLLELLAPVVPWPVMYETLRTRFVRRPDWVSHLDTVLKNLNVTYISDEGYRVEAYATTVEFATRRRRRPISMVDMVCRLLIADPNVRIDFLLTTNPSDFRDVCADRGVEIL